MAIRILATGGTFDKEYNERTGQLYFKNTHIAEMLRLGRSQVDVSIRTVMMTDSLDMTDADRNLIVQNCLQSDEDRIVITHGTDTMTETAAAIAGAVTGKTIVLTGAMIPYAFGSSDGLFNLGSALVCAGTASRSLHCHTRSMLSLGPRPKKSRARRIRGNSAGLSAKSLGHLNR